MDMNIYLAEWCVKERIGDLRDAVARARLAESVRPAPRLRVALGQALIELGRRLQGCRAGAPRSAGTPAAF